MYSRLSSVNGSPAKPPYSAATSRPATSSSPSHSFFVAHHRELVPPPSRVRSIRLSPTQYRTECGTGLSWWRPSMRPPPGGSKAKAFQAQRGHDALEGPAAVGPGAQVQQRAVRAVDEPRGLVQGQVAHVAFAQIEADARLRGTGTGLGEHDGRRVDADHRLACCLRDRDGHPVVPDGKLD